MQIDTDGPVALQIETTPAEPILNDSQNPVSIQVSIGLSEDVRDGDSPELFFTVEDSLSVPSEVVLNHDSGNVWTGSFVAPPQAGQAGPETIVFTYQSIDGLGNAGTTILGQSRFQIYQGDLPPLDVPQGLTAEALPGGEVRLQWLPVDGAADYQLYRQGPGEPQLSALTRTGGATIRQDDTETDGTYVYAVASVRSVNASEAVSDTSDTVSVEADSVSPDPPENLQLDLQADGIHASWSPAAGEIPASYNLYRSDQLEMTSVEGLTPVLSENRGYRRRGHATVGRRTRLRGHSPGRRGQRIGAFGFRVSEFRPSSRRAPSTWSTRISTCPC